MKRKIILKEAGVLLIALVIVFSSVVVTANTNDDTQAVILVSPKSSTVNKQVNPQTLDGIVVWDNGMHYENALAAQYDPDSPLIAYSADDFTEPDLHLAGVFWICAYTGQNYQEGASTWCIAFYYDRGDGNAPGELVQEPYCYEWEEIEKVFLEDDGNAIYYELSVDLPHNILFEGYNKYWISIWGECTNPPQSMWGFHESPILLHEAVFKSDTFHYPQWTDTSIVLGYSIDMCFQLTTKDCSELCCEGALKWAGIKPGAVVTGTFEVWNCGCEYSDLCWVVDSWPNFGQWTFNPSSGNLHASDNITVKVFVDTTGLTKGQTYTGKVTIKNCNNPNEIYEIDVILTMPRNKTYTDRPFLNFLQNIMERFPLFARLLRF